ncbi:MAG TPA: hypothetical protein VJR05_01590 [Acidimicrobiia bacterium]|nr:hypothetical protein [Acidimicrobiia bacterium]
MAHIQRCREGQHRFEDVPGAGAGLERRKCLSCGSVVIDLTTEESVTERPAGLFAPRRPTLFSVRPDDAGEAVASGAGFGRSRARR